MLDERDVVGRGRLVAVRREGRVAVAVAAQVHDDHAVARGEEVGDDVVVGGAEVAHAGGGGDERAGALVGVGEASLGAGEVAHGRVLARGHSPKASAISQRGQEFRRSRPAGSGRPA
ncbi:Uncharacterised protein [Mycobacteroides abscessus]|nr:Uncharacterised protein [Mycobacteroides abscessus]